VVRFCISSRDDFVSDVFRKGNIHQPVAVNVPEFSLA